MRPEPGAAIFEKNNSKRQIRLGIDYKIVFSVFVICKLYVNMYMALGKIQVSLLLVLPLSYSGSFQGYLGSYLTTWPGDPRVLSQPHLTASASLPDLTSPRSHWRNVSTEEEEKMGSCARWAQPR